MRDSSFILGPWRVEPARHRLVGAGGARRLTPKTMEVLLCLARQGDRVARRETLLEAVWPGAHVGEEVLTRAISDLRAALGDDRQQPRFVETIPKVGYRLMTAVEPAPPSSPMAPAGESPDRSQVAPRVAVPLAVALLAAVAAAGWLARERGRAAVATAVGEPTAAPAAGPLDATPLTALGDFASFAELSPDGRWVAFSHRAPEAHALDLYLVAAAGGPPRRLTDGPANDVGAAWSPDGRRIAFQRFSGGDDSEARCTILEIPFQGGPERTLGSCGGNVTADLAWSPSGEWLAFSDRERPDETFGIFLLSAVDGGRRKLVAPDGEHWGDRDPAFSPDGTQVAFTRSVSMATQDVFRIPVAGGEPVPVTRDGRSLRGHAWTADGSALIVSSRRTGARGLWRFPLDGGEPTWLPIAVAHAWSPTLGRAGGSPLVFERRDLRAGIVRRRLDAAAGGDATAAGDDAADAATPWLEPSFEDLDPRHAPDGGRVAFASDRSGGFEIWVAGEDGAEPTQLTALGGSFNGAPAWSPDGRWIVFDARIDGQADLYRVPADGGAPTRLTDHPANDLDASYTADGTRIFFGSNRSGRWQIWRLDATGGDAEPVTRDGGYRALATADGSELLLTRYGTDGLFRHHLATGTTQPEPDTEALVGRSHWTLVGDTLYWLAAADDGVVLLRRRPDGPIERLAELGTASLMSGFSVAPDERSALWSAIAHLASDLWRADLGP